MAERRMFCKSIVLSDAFLDMPLSARCLYFTLGMLADDDGFVGSPKAIMRQCGASQDDMLVLMQKRFILAFESGVIVIKHWRMNNYLRSDRHTATNYTDELAQITLDDKGAYTERARLTGGIPSDNQSVTEDSIGKVSIGKVSIGGKKETINNKIKNKIGIYNNVEITDTDLAELKEKCPSWEFYIDRLSRYMHDNNKTYADHKGTILSWYSEDKAKGKAPTPPTPSAKAAYEIDEWAANNKKPIKYKGGKKT